MVCDLQTLHAVNRFTPLSTRSHANGAAHAPHRDITIIIVLHISRLIFKNRRLMCNVMIYLCYYFNVVVTLYWAGELLLFFEKPRGKKNRQREP